MPPPTGAALASLGAHCDRRRSSTSDIFEIRETVNDAFKLLDKDGNGKLTVSEIAEGMKMLLPSIKDPLNEADSICAAIDSNGDGTIDIDEFFIYIQPTCHRWVAARKEMVVEEILTDAFRETLNRDKAVRDSVIESFMNSQKKHLALSAANGMPVNKAWVNKLFDELYSEPTDADAPVYKSQRADYLKVKLAEMLDVSRVEQNKGPKDAKKAKSPMEARIGSGPIPQMSAADKKKAAFRKQMASMAPDSGSFSSFCKDWLEELEDIQKRPAYSHSVGASREGSSASGGHVGPSSSN